MSAHENQIRRPLPREKRDQVPGITPRYHYFRGNADRLEPLDGERGYLFPSVFHLFSHGRSSMAMFAPYFWGDIRVSYN
jgi:hypothetical protein